MTQLSGQPPPPTSKPRLVPHARFPNVLKRLRNRSWTGHGECRLCVSFLNPHSEHAETCSTAEATRGHHACVHAWVCGLKLAVSGITTEPRGLTVSQSRQAGRSAALDVCVASPNEAAARVVASQAAVGRKLTHERAKFQNCVTKVFTIVPMSGQKTDDQSLAHSNVRQKSHPTEMASKCRQNYLSANGNTRFGQPCFEDEQPCRGQSCQTPLHAQSGSSLALSTEPYLDRQADFETDTAMPDDDDDLASIYLSNPSSNLDSQTRSDSFFCSFGAALSFQVMARAIHLTSLGAISESQVQTGFSLRICLKIMVCRGFTHVKNLLSR